MAHQEDDLCFETTNSLLLLRNDSVKKTSDHEQNKI